MERRDSNEVFRELYPSCENISIDYAVLEPRSTKGEHHSNIYCLPADFGWNDLGSWAALYEHQLAQGNAKDGNVTEAKGSLALDARNNYVYSPDKFVALVGVDDLVVVETEDAILITTRERSQDVRRVVSELAGQARRTADLNRLPAMHSFRHRWLARNDRCRLYR